MTKEELKQEARKDVESLNGIDLVSSTMIAIDKYGAYKLGRYDGYLAAAEPREKWIAHLEAQIEQNKIDLAISEHDREHDDYELTEVYTKVEQLEKENAKLKCNCRTCVYTDSPCVRSDYPSKDGVCSHYKNVFEENVELKEENKTVSRKANEAIADKLLITAKYNEVLNDLNQENDKLQKENANLKLRLEALEGQTPWEDIKDKSELIGRLTRAKEIIKEMLSVLPKENIEGIYEITEEAEQFLKDCEVNK